MRFALALLLLLFSTPLHAETVNGLLYTAQGSLRVVGFDGTGFTGPFTLLTALSPDWTAMSYDPASGSLHYVANSSLRVVGFDGTGFTGPFTLLTALSPDWGGMALLYAPAPPPPAVIPLPAAGGLLLAALGALVLSRRKPR